MRRALGPWLRHIDRMNSASATDKAKPRHGRGPAAPLGRYLRHGTLGIALLFVALQTDAARAAETTTPAALKSAEMVRVTLDQMHQLDVVKVETYPFKVQRPAIGRIAYNEDASTLVLAPFSGRVIRLIAKVGDAVKRGDPLFEIDSPEVVQPQNDFIAALAALNKARSQLNLAQIVEKRQRGLYEGKAAPLKEFQLAEAALVAAQNDMRAAETALEAVRNRLIIIGLTKDQIANLKEKREIHRAMIYAPIDGTVIARKVGPGQHVRNDTGDPLFTIANLSTMWLKALVPENQISLIRVGQEVEVEIAALPGRVFNARITAIEASADPTTRRIVVRSEIPNPDGVLKSEMFASFKIVTGVSMRSPAVPVDAVIREGDRASVWIEEQPMLFKRRKVNIGLEQNNRIQILDGLRTGETVVARGAIFVDNEWRQ
jgi:cobalt-zinc-cadmium efflux system membrane fusion protein